MLSFLAVACTALDVTVESVENHSPFSEQTDGSRSNENTVFTKEELAKYNGEDVGLAYTLPCHFALKIFFFLIQER